MAELSDIQNEIVRQEIDEYIQREDERAEIISLYSKTSPLMQEIAAGIIGGKNKLVDELTDRALNDEKIDALVIMDDGLICRNGDCGH